MPAFVTEFVNRVHDDDRLTLSEEEWKHYIYGALNGLDEAHSRGIMHRDIKPENIGFDRITRTTKLLDWGLSRFYHAYQEYHPNVGSRYYNAPEVLAEVERYHFSQDVWAVGVILASFVFQKKVFIRGEDDDHQLEMISRILGTADLEAYALKYGAKVYRKGFYMMPRVPLSSFISPKNEKYATDDALDLLDRILVYDHMERITASEAMQHPYFDSIMEWVDTSDNNAYY